MDMGRDPSVKVIFHSSNRQDLKRHNTQLVGDKFSRYNSCRRVKEEIDIREERIWHFPYLSSQNSGKL